MSTEEIAGRYRLEGRLGFGGMSTVHLALDQRLERQVAVKLLAEHLADDPAFVSRFQREAQAAARLVHPNIVQVFDSGRDERSGQYFIVMEYIEGSSCAEILRDDGWVEVDEALSIIEQACEGLHYAHRHGVVHRDVKPGNLLRAREGEVKLADFGIAKATEQSSITQVGSVLGTAAYLAPEQARGEEAGPSADLYALGVVTYQLISGRLPYEATSLTELALKQQQEEPPHARHARRRRQPRARRRRRDRARARPARTLRDRARDAPRPQRRRPRASRPPSRARRRAARPPRRAPRPSSRPAARPPGPAERAARQRRRPAGRAQGPPAAAAARATCAGAGRQRAGRTSRLLGCSLGPARVVVLAVIAVVSGQRAVLDEGRAAQRRLLRRSAGSSALKQLVAENTK